MTYANPRRGRELIAESLVWLSEGVSVVPAQPQSKAVMLRWRQFEVNPPTLKDIRFWFESGVMNLAVICGTGSGSAGSLLVLDFDNLENYKAWKPRAGALAGTYTEITGRGVHLFYKVDKPITKCFVECEALGLGHLCLVAPSIHPSGRLYKPLGDPCIPLLEVKTDELFSLLSEPLPKHGKGEDREELSKAVRTRRALAGADPITQIKAALPLYDYASSLTQLKRSSADGRFFVGCCPIHEDENPSFWVDAKRGIWRCFVPSCPGSKGGDVLNLYALTHNITVHEAIKKLAREVL